ncbi:hypothetical protein [uncultured Lutibacter sp.]|uniref:hypothetical protein n=1 Tax=uncultured Lutibacter sp. TaxID=437739 RepID=UPI00261EC38E|nr:hypothetical protein [uncultured Lutibacter sp.]
MKRILLIIFLIPTLLFSQGKLKKAKESLSESSTTSTSNSTTRNDRGTRTSRNNRLNSSNNNGFFQDFFVELGFYAFYGTVIGQSEYRSLTPHPYYKNTFGEYLKEDSISSKNSIFKISAIRHFNIRINGLEINANYRILPIFGLEASYIHFSERTIVGSDFLEISSLMANYYRIREKNISLWWGLGASYVGNGIQKVGFAYNIGTEIYPFKPISLHASWKQSFINSTSIDVFKTQIKYHIKNTAIFTGYHDFKLGSEKNGGFILGMEYTF